MSWNPSAEPVCNDCETTPAVELRIEGRARDLGGFDVRRLLPAASRRLVGPFIFFDQMGPTVFPPGRGIDVRPHPHINLATVTYLFEGEIFHRDSVGSAQSIRPGAINWMTAGRGIVHSERTAPEVLAREARLHGIQAWVALPREHEEVDPAFAHYSAEQLPVIDRGGARIRLLVGEAWGVRSPVATLSPVFYADAAMAEDAALEVPTAVEERAVYVAQGEVRIGDEALSVGQMAVLGRGATAVVQAATSSRVMLLGGAPLDGERHIWWNFVSSRLDRIEDAKRAWKAREMPIVPGDESERIPLPE